MPDRLKPLDFGRTDFENGGLRAFKSGWGAEERTLCYTSFGAAPAAAHGRGGIESALGTVIRHAPRWVCSTIGAGLYRFAA